MWCECERKWVSRILLSILSSCELLLQLLMSSSLHACRRKFCVGLICKYNLMPFLLSFENIHTYIFCFSQNVGNASWNFELVLCIVLKIENIWKRIRKKIVQISFTFICYKSINYWQCRSLFWIRGVFRARCSIHRIKHLKSHSIWMNETPYFYLVSWSLSIEEFCF